MADGQSMVFWLLPPTGSTEEECLLLLHCSLNSTFHLLVPVSLPSNSCQTGGCCLCLRFKGKSRGDVLTTLNTLLSPSFFTMPNSLASGLHVKPPFLLTTGPQMPAPPAIASGKGRGLPERLSHHRFSPPTVNGASSKLCSFRTCLILACPHSICSPLSQVASF